MHEKLRLPTGCDGRIWHHDNQGAMRAPHRHDELEFNLVTRGHAAYLLGERRYALRPGSLLWLFPAQDHVLLEESPDYGMWIGVFKPELVTRVCTAERTSALCQPDPPGWFCRVLTEGSAGQLTRLLQELSGLADNPAHLNAGLGYALLSAWAAYEGADAGGDGRDIHPAIERTVRLLRDETEPLSLERIAAQAGLSPSRLSRLFRQQIGVPLVEFRNTQRLDRFLRLYGQGRRVGLTDAAFEAGFGSYAQFHRVFTRYMGCRPQEYRRRLGKGIRGADGEKGADTEREKE